VASDECTTVAELLVVTSPVVSISQRALFVYDGCALPFAENAGDGHETLGRIA